jgi:hypothetical protein
MASYKNNCFSNARSRQRPVDQIYLFGKVQSHRIVSRFTVFAPDQNLLSGVHLAISLPPLTQTAPLEGISTGGLA